MVRIFPAKDRFLFILSMKRRQTVFAGGGGSKLSGYDAVWFLCNHFTTSHINFEVPNPFHLYSHTHFPRNTFHDKTATRQAKKRPNVSTTFSPPPKKSRATSLLQSTPSPTTMSNSSLTPSQITSSSTRLTKMNSKLSSTHLRIMKLSLGRRSFGKGRLAVTSIF